MKGPVGLFIYEVISCKVQVGFALAHTYLKLSICSVRQEAGKVGGSVRGQACFPSSQVMFTGRNEVPPTGWWTWNTVKSWNLLAVRTPGAGTQDLPEFQGLVPGLDGRKYHAAQTEIQALQAYAAPTLC